MQYPIIDNLIYAYETNNWTGLNIVKSLNLFHPHDKTEILNGITLTLNNGVFSFNGAASDTTTFKFNVDDFIIPLAVSKGGNGVMYFFNTFNSTNVTVSFLYNSNIIDSWKLSPINRVSSSYVSQANKHVNEIEITFTNGAPNRGQFSIMFTDYGIIFDTFIEWFQPKTDLPHRLKLPLLHYFPHAVIDALISAADGQQTAEENEILRHYLTPLGIGGI